MVDFCWNGCMLTKFSLHEYQLWRVAVIERVLSALWHFGKSL